MSHSRNKLQCHLEKNRRMDGCQGQRDPQPAFFLPLLPSTIFQGREMIWWRRLSKKMRDEEQFVKHLTQIALKKSSEEGVEKGVEYSHLADIVSSEDTLQFLQDIVPAKIKFTEYQAMMEKPKRKSIE
ncbi:hypothetical protein CAPTEDRAFT_197233 [Capitella teleta]|uniref:Uncharacterized protein n=1 Tax=Capitella teleta TaxID=283909 RepID=R7U2T9_CAPTE|nr:hypothetical protein CAPTEDRAFT_197233 [Capitella teleta]|eukprot:ELT97971.1 hypothetical protein CAPTEDRAFT_197233 [Capitella teleta]